MNDWQIRRWIAAVAFALLACAGSAAAARADCAKALANDRTEALAQLKIFHEPDAAVKRRLMKEDANRLMAAMRADTDPGDFRSYDCKNLAAMYYALANELSGLNAYAVYGVRVNVFPIATLEPFVGKAELTPALYKSMLSAEFYYYRATNKPVPPDLQKVMQKYFPAE